MTLLLFVLGLVFGSFVNVLIYRLPKNLSILGRSFCPKCKNKISWFDNIPLISYLLLLGRCRSCKKKISLRFPLIELTTALGFVAVAYFHYPVYFYFLVPLLICIFVIDLEHQFIPDGLIFIGIIVWILFFLLSPVPYPLFANFLAGFASAFFLLTLHLITKGKGMGLGDVKFAILGGLIVGPGLFLIWLLLAFLTGAAIGIILILGRKAHLKSRIAFGPFLVLAIPLALLYGEKILFWIHLD